MSVFTFDTRAGNPVTTAELDRVCDRLGIAIPDAEKEDYRRLLAVFHESAEGLLALPPYTLPLDLERFPRTDVHAPAPADNPLGAWSQRCTIQDTRAAEGERPLSGKTVAFKANVAIAGVRTNQGSAIFADDVPAIDATAVTRVLLAGGTVSGLAVCENLCHSATSHSSSTGVVHNPHAHGYSSGGSSSGCAALVAGGAVDMALGADQGGSIRVPACWCGIVGLKPTFGLVPYTGLGSNEPTNDHAGPMTRTVLENARFLAAIAGNDDIDDRSFGSPLPDAVPDYVGLVLQQHAGQAGPSSASLAGVRIGVIAESRTRPGMDPRVLQVFDAAMERFRALGATVETVSIPTHCQGPAIWTAISKIGGAYTKLGPVTGRRGFALESHDAPFRPLTQATWDLLYPSTKNTLLNGVYGHEAFPQLAARATNLSLGLRRAYDAALSGEGADGKTEAYTVLATPTLPCIANPHAPVPFAAATPSYPEAHPAAPLDLLGAQVGLTSNTCPFDQSGHPALTLPCGRLPIVEGPLAHSGTTLPVGLQLIGRWFGETDVYRVAYAWEQANDWEKM